jgi:hypothetical protein
MILETITTGNRFSGATNGYGPSLSLWEVVNRLVMESTGLSTKLRKKNFCLLKEVALELARRNKMQLQTRLGKDPRQLQLHRIRNQDNFNLSSSLEVELMLDLKKCRLNNNFSTTDNSK